MIDLLPRFRRAERMVILVFSVLSAQLGSLGVDML